MIFVFPIRTSIRPWRTPYVNYALIGINAFIFFATYAWPATGAHDLLRQWAVQFMLTPAKPALWQFISYAFLHGSVMHLVGNMFFLYLFGNNVNDKLGSVGYLCLYLAGAVFSAIGHTLLSGTNVLGASGAVAAVTGAYLVLFPQTLVTLYYWIIFFIGTFEVSALYFIGFKLIFWDNMALRSMPNVAYDAHLAGYAFGIGAMILMLRTGLISGSDFDLWTMLKQWDKRRKYRGAVSDGYNRFTSQRQVKKIKVKEIKKTSAQKKAEHKIKQLRLEINQRLSQRNLAAATEVYLELTKIDSSQVPPLQHLLDISNQLASENKHAEAAQAYEKFLKHYRKYEYIEQVELMLGIIYSRYLDKNELAVKYLRLAAGKLSDSGQLKMCNDELDHLTG